MLQLSAVFGIDTPPPLPTDILIHTQTDIQWTVMCDVQMYGKNIQVSKISLFEHGCMYTYINLYSYCLHILILFILLPKDIFIFIGGVTLYVRHDFSLLLVTAWTLQF